jgi:hypothetical protein
MQNRCDTLWNEAPQSPQKAAFRLLGGGDEDWPGARGETPMGGGDEDCMKEFMDRRRAATVMGFAAMAIGLDASPRHN